MHMLQLTDISIALTHSLTHSLTYRYNSQFQITNTIELRHVSTDAAAAQGKAPTIKRVTDAVLMTNAWRICVATTARELQFFHASSGMLVHTVVTPNIVT
jgi:hypothetical protein